MTHKQYAERDAMALDKAGGHYGRHVQAMTAEKLHDKSDIAAELGYRDMQIAALQWQVSALAAEGAALKSAHPQPFGPAMMAALDAYVKREDDCPEQGMLDAFFILRDSINVTTPATDAYLNSMRADAIDEFWQKSLRDTALCLSGIRTFDKANDRYKAEDIVHSEIKERVEEFAAQLRAGEQGGDHA